METLAHLLAKNITRFEADSFLSGAWLSLVVPNLIQGAEAQP